MDNRPNPQAGGWWTWPMVLGAVAIVAAALAAPTLILWLGSP